jgi:phosphonate transport system permease protein
MLPPTSGSAAHLWIYLQALGQTLAIAFLGTAAAAVIALPLGFLAAQNVVSGRVVHFLARRGLDCVRSVDTLIWALIWINVVGLGPFAGALAIASTDLAGLAKLMSETIETAERGPVESVLASGGRRFAVIRFGLLPQVCRYSPARRCISSNPIPDRQPSSESSAPVASVSIFRK